IGVIQQGLDARDAADQVEEGLRARQVVERSPGFAEAADTLDRRLATELACLVTRVAALERRELREQRIGVGGREEAVDDDVAEWIALRERGGVSFGAGGHAGVDALVEGRGFHGRA